MATRVRFESDAPSMTNPSQHLPTTLRQMDRSYAPTGRSFPSIEHYSPSPNRLEAHHEITLLDHQIAQQGGTTSAIARLPHQIQKTKSRISDKERIEELTRDLQAQLEENDHVKRVNYELNRFREQVVVAFKGLRNAQHELSTRVAQSEQKLSKYWGFDLDDTADDDVRVI
jgi:hypothetical protein